MDISLTPHKPTGTVHYNVIFKSGGFLNRLVASEVRGLKTVEIAWIYLVEEKRNATAEEIKRLCKGKPNDTSQS